MFKVIDNTKKGGNIMNDVDAIIMDLYNNTDHLRDECHALATKIEYFLCDYTIAQKKLEEKGIELGKDIFDDYQGWAEALEDVLNKLEELGLA